MMTTKSPWKTGTYQMIVQERAEGDPGDLLITVWGVPKTSAKAHGVPSLILAKVEVIWEEYNQLPPARLMGAHYVGKGTGLQPEDIEELYGARLAARILLALFQAAERDFWGRDMYNNKVRDERKKAFPFMERTHDTLAILMAKVHP